MARLRGAPAASRHPGDTSGDVAASERVPQLDKCPTGIPGLDAILGGGLPRGRPALVCGGPGCGKTVLAMQFIANGIAGGEPGVFVSFEEGPDDLAQNFASFGYDLGAMQRDGQFRLTHIRVERHEIEETGQYDLEALFIRLGSAVAAVGARRIVLDSIEALFSGFPNEAIVRAELRRLFNWTKERHLTAIVTGERGSGTLTRFGLEEYVADCVISLDNKAEDGAGVRRLRVVKYRGSGHGANEFPFLIDEHGLSVAPITSLTLDHAVSDERVSSGHPRLDAILGGGVFRGSSVLVSGSAGVGKSSIAATFADAACRRGERVLFLAFEESPAQIARNMRSIGLDLGGWVAAGNLNLQSTRSTAFGLEVHLTKIQQAVEAFRPAIVVLDPVSNFLSSSSTSSTTGLITRLLDMLKTQGITSIMTSLTRGGSVLEESGVAVSSLMDTWILLRELESNGERNRAIDVIKSRGSTHSNQVREFRLTDDGIEIIDVATGPNGAVVGSARLAHEALDRAAAARRAREEERKALRRRRNQEALETKIALLRLEHAALDEQIEDETSDTQTGAMSVGAARDEP